MGCGCGCGSSNACTRGVALGGLQTLGLNGQSVYAYQAYAMDAAGTGFSLTYTGVETYRAVLFSSVQIASPVQANFAGLFQKWTGDNGVPGAISREWVFSSNTATSDPTATFLKLNNSDATAAGEVNISKTDRLSVVVGPLIALCNVSTSTVKAYVQITKKTDNSKFALYRVDAFVDNGAWDTLSVTYVSGSGTGPFTLNDEVVFSISVVGDTGTTGVTILYNNLSLPGSTGSGAVEVIDTYSIPGGTMGAVGDRINIEARFMNLNPNLDYGDIGADTDEERCGLQVGATQTMEMSQTGFPMWGVGVSSPERLIRVSLNRIDGSSYLLTATTTVPDLTGLFLTSSIVVTGVNFANPIAVNALAVDVIITTPFVAGVQLRQLYVEKIPA